jgi:16S rRNA (guanine527-N7)-methyltransferase
LTLNPPDSFLTRVADLGIEFEAGDAEKLGLYLELLLDANTRFNLTAITDPNEAWTRHILDSLTLVPVIVSLTESGAGGTGVSPVRIIDIGSGGGLPGIPLAITLPDIQFTLVEATGKKARFLEEVARQLELSNVQVVSDRAETIGQDHVNYRERFDVVLARAVGRLPVLLELTVPLAKVEGHVLAMKGTKAAEEIEESKRALHLLHAHVIDSIATPTGTLVIIQKMRKTPRNYPRAPGEPKRSPLA